jgi:hypothetical protein
LAAGQQQAGQRALRRSLELDPQHAGADQVRAALGEAK